MELTWVTFPLIVVTVSLLAYFAAYVVKGTRAPGQQGRRRRRRPAVGPVAGEQLVRTCSARRTATTDGRGSCRYRSTADGPPTRGEPARAPGRDRGAAELVRRPRAGFGGMGQRGRMGFASGGYAYEPAGRAERLEGVRVPIWSTKCFDRPLVRARRRGRRRRPAAGRPRPPRGDRDQPPGRPAERRHPRLRRAGLPPRHDRAGAAVRVELTPNRTSRAYLRASGRQVLAARSPRLRPGVQHQPARPGARA